MSIMNLRCYNQSSFPLHYSHPHQFDNHLIGSCHYLCVCVCDIQDYVMRFCANIDRCDPVNMEIMCCTCCQIDYN